MVHAADPRVLSRKAEWHIAKNQYDDATTILETIRTLQEFPEANVLYAYSRWKRGRADDFAPAKEAALAALADDRVQGQARLDATEILLNLERAMNGASAARDLLTELEKDLTPYRFADWAIRLDLQRGAMADACARAQALYATRAELSLEDSRRLGIRLRECALMTEAFEVLREIAPRDLLDPSTVALLAAADATRNSEFLIQLCTDLEAAGVDQPQLIDVHAVALAKRRDFSRAISVVKSYLTSHDSAIVRLRLALLGVAISDRSLAEPDSGKLPAPAVGMAEQAIQVVAALRFANQRLSALEFAYVNYRLNREDPSAWRAVLEAFIPPGDDLVIAEPNVVAVDCAVKFREISGEWQWLIIEENAPESACHEFSASHPFVAAMLGKGPSESFFVARNLLPPKRYEIAEIKSKYIHLYHKCLNEWERQFPNIPGPLMIDLPEDPNGIIDILTPLVRAKAANVEALVQIYTDTPPCSLHVLTNGLGGTIFSTMSTLAQSKRTELRVAPSPEIQSMEGHPSDVVLESTALATLLLTGHTDLLLRVPQRMHVAQGTIDELKAFRRSVDEHGEGYVHMLDGRVQFDLVDIESKARILSTIDRMSTILAERAEIFIESDRNRLKPREWDTWVSLGGIGAAESLHRCVRAGNLFWTDDGALAHFAGQHGVRTVNTQVYAEWLATVEPSLIDEWYILSAKLVGCRFTPTKVLPQMYLAAARQADWVQTNWPLAEHISLFGGTPWSPLQVIALGVDVLRLWWQGSGSDQRASALTIALLDSIRDRENGCSLIRSIARRLPAAFSLDALTLERCRSVVEAWIRFSDGLVLAS